MIIDSLPFDRWREVEIHHVDMAVRFELTDWSPGLIEICGYLSPIGYETAHAA